MSTVIVAATVVERLAPSERSASGEEQWSLTLTA